MSKLEKASHWAVILGTVIGLIGFWYLIDSIEISRDGLTETRRQFVAAQRPVVMTGKIAQRESSVFGPGHKISWNIYPGNYGPMPAVNFAVHHKLAHGPNARAEIDKFFQQLPARLPVNFGAIPPGQPGEGPGFTTAESDAPLTPDEFTAASGDFGVVMGGRFEYEDLAGNLYRTDFCATRLKSGAFAKCRWGHNEMSEQLKDQQRTINSIANAGLSAHYLHSAVGVQFYPIPFS